MEQETKTTPAVEVWRPVRDFEGLYEVSNLARVRSVERYVQFGRSQRFIESHVLTQQPMPTGYLTVSLKDKKRKVSRTVHRIVAEAFVPNPNNLKDVNHKDEDKTNNLPSNLEWCDRKYNINYGTGKYRKTESYRKPIEQLTIDGQHVAYFESARQAARVTDYKQSRLWEALSGKRQTAYGYRWRYI